MAVAHQLKKQHEQFAWICLGPRPSTRAPKGFLLQASVGAFATTGIGGGVTIGIVTCRQQAVELWNGLRPVSAVGPVYGWFVRASTRAICRASRTEKINATKSA
jgi:hypothetical protein